MTRAERIAEATRLRAEGLNGTEIAKRMGIATSYAYELLADPNREKVKERRRRYSRECEVCGTLTDGSNGPASAPTRCHEHAIPVPREERVAHIQAMPRHEEFAAMYRAGASYPELAAHFGVSKGRVSNWLDRLRRYGWELPYRYSEDRRKAAQDGKQVAA